VSEFTAENLERQDIVSVAKAYAEALIEDLEGKNDFLPFLVIQPKDTTFDSGNWNLLVMQMPEDPEQKNRVADYMTAACAIYNAEEVVFCTAGWAVQNPCAEELQMAPSDSPMRVEKVLIAHSTRFTGNTVGHHSADLHRVNNKVFTSPWDYMTMRAAGRFAEAITLGFKLAVDMPPDVREGVVEMIAEGSEQKLLNATANMINSAREEARKQVGDFPPAGDMLLGDADE